MILPKLRSAIRRLARAERTEPQDDRGSRVVAVIECILNQNARDFGAASCPALNAAVVRLCAEHRVGILQIPCPEKEHLGLRRNRPRGTSIRTALETEHGRRCCAELADCVADRLLDYSRNGCRVMAILGGNAESPGCAVVAGPGGLSARSGVLILALDKALRMRNMSVPFRAIRDIDATLEQEDLERLRTTLHPADS